MSSLVIINGVVYDVVSTSEPLVCRKCEFTESLESDVWCPRLNDVENRLSHPELICTWLDKIDGSFHYFIKREV